MLLPSLNSRAALDCSSWFAYLLLSIYVRESRDGFVDGLDCTSESFLLAVEAKVALVLRSWLRVQQCLGPVLELLTVRNVEGRLPGFIESTLTISLGQTGVNIL